MTRQGRGKTQYYTIIVRGIEKLSRNIFLLKTEIINRVFKAEPPQFLMLWIPGYEAIPMSIAWLRDNELWFIVKPVGETTKKLVETSNGEYLGIYGPLGKPLIPNGNNYLLISGGSGLATIMHYIQKICTEKNCRLIYGSWTYGEIGRIPSFIKKYGVKTNTVCLDDRCSYNGVLADYLKTIDLDRYDYIIICGSKNMVKSLVEKLGKHRDKTIVVLESIVKCGIGLCGSCRIFPETDLLLCIDGPGFYLREVYKYIMRW